MDRTVPKTGSEEIELYMRTYYSLLRSTQTIDIETLVESHMAMESSLHIHAREPQPDISALAYSSLRLPPCMTEIDHVVVGQVDANFLDGGYGNVPEWDQVEAPARRRRWHYDGQTTLAVYIASRSDIDDLVPILTAYQIEWNKLHNLLQKEVARLFLSQNGTSSELPNAEEIDLLAGVMGIDTDAVERLVGAWGHGFVPSLSKIAAARKNLGLRLISGSLSDYRRATAFWWREIQQRANEWVDLEQRPVYFVSSNTQAIPNMLTGFALRHQDALVEYMQAKQHHDLLKEYEAITNSAGRTNLNNFLYYVLKKYLRDADESVQTALRDDEEATGIGRVPSRHGFDVEAQVIELRQVREAWLDPRLIENDIDCSVFQRSDAIILNIDYPLGMAAYELLSRVTERAGRLLGVYVMGKAATLNGRVNDVMIPNVIHDEHSQNTYLFNTCFGAVDVAPYLTFGTVLDNQKAISAPGTFLQNPRYMSVFYHEGYTDIEMEGGPYLSAVYEAFRPKRHPQNEVVNLYAVPFDIGFLHYASDTPMSKGHNLGATNLSYAGVESTYATAVAILRRILKQEAHRLAQK